MPRVLLSGFGPFGSLRSNISESVVRLFEDWPGYRVDTVVLPVAFGHAWELLHERIHQVQPDLVLALGVAEDREHITPELVALNYMNARIPDNRGHQPRNRLITPNAPTAYFARLPVAEVTEALVRAGFPASLSYSAGAFVCNELMYRLLHALHHDGELPSVSRGGFIHLPGRDRLAGGPKELKRALQLAVESAWMSGATARTGSRRPDGEITTEPPVTSDRQ